MKGKPLDMAWCYTHELIATMVMTCTRSRSNSSMEEGGAPDVLT